jgi:DNA-binding XRE family transcriptional regulator
MRHSQTVAAKALAALAKQAREKAGKTRQQAADDMGVSWASIFQAEEEPHRSLFELRRRMLERYARITAEGPLYRLRRIRRKAS